uniref:Uncharacterized protein n=1 Tax=Anguilla anguilla TaxID=7936 RepID=A0A0E9QAM2_ANGAN
MARRLHSGLRLCIFVRYPSVEPRHDASIGSFFFLIIKTCANFIGQTQRRHTGQNGGLGAVNKGEVHSGNSSPEAEDLSMAVATEVKYKVSIPFLFISLYLYILN